jgi:hypothetical protein
MRYFLDCEFNGFGGDLLTLALVREDGHSLYLGYPLNDLSADMEPWVYENVYPKITQVPEHVAVRQVNQAEGAYLIAEFLRGDPRPYIVTDWPDDVRYFCQAVITGPGMMAAIPSLRFEVVRVDAYPTKVKGAVQHNAWWDAMALRELLLETDNLGLPPKTPLFRADPDKSGNIVRSILGVEESGRIVDGQFVADAA